MIYPICHRVLVTYFRYNTVLHIPLICHIYIFHVLRLLLLYPFFVPVTYLWYIIPRVLFILHVFYTFEVQCTVLDIPFICHHYIFRLQCSVPDIPLVCHRYTYKVQHMLALYLFYVTITYVRNNLKCNPLFLHF